MDASKKTQKSFNTILDCMTGADGGVSFVKLKIMIEGLDELALQENKAGNDARKILIIMDQFAKLIEIANALANGENYEIQNNVQRS